MGLGFYLEDGEGNVSVKLAGATSDRIDTIPPNEPLRKGEMIFVADFDQSGLCSDTGSGVMMTGVLFHTVTPDWCNHCEERTIVEKTNMFNQEAISESVLGDEPSELKISFISTDMSDTISELYGTKFFCGNHMVQLQKTYTSRGDGHYPAAVEEWFYGVDQVFRDGLGINSATNIETARLIESTSGFISSESEQEAGSYTLSIVF